MVFIYLLNSFEFIQKLLLKVGMEWDGNILVSVVLVISLCNYWIHCYSHLLILTVCTRRGTVQGRDRLTSGQVHKHTAIFQHMTKV